jgi:hypothetical protein
MRVPAGMVVGGALLVAAGLAVAASPTQQFPPEEAHVGCMHTDLRPCIITLGSALWFDVAKVAHEISLRNELDVNGKTARRTIGIIAGVPKRPERITIVLTLASPAPNDTVVKAEILLSSDPETVHTQSEYDKTLLYDAVTPLLGNRCPGLDRLTLYRFYENELKPQETTKAEVQTNGVVQHTVVSNDTGKIPFCGASFSLHRRTEYDGMPDNPAKRGFKSGAYLVME